MDIEIFYDKDCPFCNSYANYIKIKEEHNLVLKNVREFKEEVESFKSRGININNGFVVRVDNKTLYQGVDAIVFLNKLANKGIYFPDNPFFRYVIYPIIKSFRKFLLYILGKDVNI